MRSPFFAKATKGILLRIELDGSSCRSAEREAGWCPWPESNQHSLRNSILSRARLPVPPQGPRVGEKPLAAARIIAREGRGSTAIAPCHTLFARIIREISAGRRNRPQHACRRARLHVMRAARPGGSVHPLPERWQSGRMHRTRNAAWVQAHRGFESLPLRHPASRCALRRISLGLNSKQRCVMMPVHLRRSY